MPRRLKVFVTSDGLTDYVVAASSRAKALAAWGLRHDLFKDGQAHETDDPSLVKAASAAPGRVLRRPAGTRRQLKAMKPAKLPMPKGPGKAQRKRIAGLEAKLAALDADGNAARAAFTRAQAALARKAEAAEAKRAAERDRLMQKLAQARAAPK